MVAAVVGVALCAVSIWVLAGRGWVSQPESRTLDDLAIARTDLEDLSNVAPVVPAVPSKLAQSTATNLRGNTQTAANRQGKLRVGNATEHPIRVALLIKATDPGVPGYEAPAHWDFDPGEGSNDGLVLSLPKRTLKLKKGDVLVAFAQDGSRRYWGPYVVGETPTPSWNAKGAEWQLVFEP